MTCLAENIYSGPKLLDGRRRMTLRALENLRQICANEAFKQGVEKGGKIRNDCAKLLICIGVAP